ncbi:hypothetical protein J6590_070300 [Homalodisca vitripennis]|nr:hypothetical protein J6590_070300 [Homalodisca vitripennis]
MGTPDPNDQHSTLRTLYGNVQCLTSKVLDIEMLCSYDSYSVFCFVEHWLDLWFHPSVNFCQRALNTWWCCYLRQRLFRGSVNFASSWHNVLRSAGLHCTNFKPTKDKACIDNIATNLDPSSYRLEVHDWSRSDHSFLSTEIAEAYTKLNTVSVGKSEPNK